MMDNELKLLQASILHESTMGRLGVLATEYVDKQITAERFAKRCVELICENRQEIINLTKEYKA